MSNHTDPMIVCDQCHQIRHWLYSMLDDMTFTEYKEAVTFLSFCLKLDLALLCRSTLLPIKPFTF